MKKAVILLVLVLVVGARFGGAFKEFMNSNAEKTTTDGGIEFVADYRTRVAKERISILSNLNIYKALNFSEAIDGEDNWKATRLDWQNTFSANITSIISVSLYIQMLYNETKLDLIDENIDEFQFKQTLSLNLTYKFL